ncbi:hypothetical protein AYO49_00605, partial [Verrucomicrobiaceae bacterium SCGC AG-212-N21]
MVVKNIGLPFINGAFSNLSQGQTVNLSYNGVRYKFAANYFGGTGNDLVLQWADTRMVAWGLNDRGMLGNGTRIKSLQPTAVDGTGLLAGKTITAMSAGFDYSMALCSDGTVAGWGFNNDGRLGDNSVTERLVPTAVYSAGVLSGKTVIAISGGFDHSLALCSDGTVVAWGSNDNGELGNAGDAASIVPVRVVTSTALAGKTVVAVSAGLNHSLALCSDGTVASWGSNIFGGLGTSSPDFISVPIAVDTSGVLAGKTVVAISAGVTHNLALCSDGAVVAWGTNSNGQLGNNSSTNSRVPVLVDMSGILADKAVVAVATGRHHSLALCSDGTVVAWGANDAGQLGNNSTIESHVPILVTSSAGSALGGRTVVSVSAGDDFSYAVCSDGIVTAWGSNGYGQLGNNTTISSKVPVAVHSGAMATGERVVASDAGGWFFSLGMSAAPASFEIEVQPDGSAPLADGTGVVNFGNVATNHMSVVVFTVRNTGTTNIAGISIDKSGTHSGDFVVDTSATSATLAPNATTTFAVAFAPGAIGVRSAAIHIHNGEAAGNPFDISLAGSGTAPPASTLALSSTRYTVNEEAGAATVRILRTGSSVGTVGVKVTTSNGTAGSADFTAISQTVSLGDGITFFEVPITTLSPLNTAEPNETFTVTLSQPTGGAAVGTPASATVLILDSVDTILPGTPVITKPSAGAMLDVNAGGSVTVTGTATDNQQIAGVEASLDNGATFTAGTVTLQGTGATYGTTATFVVNVIPVLGGNATVLVRTTDVRGNVSAVFGVRTFVVLRPLVVKVSPSGAGTVTNGFAGSTPREVGKSYTITATPKMGATFVGWTLGGGLTRQQIGVAASALEKPTLTFIFREGLELTANFEENPYDAEIAGTYTGLIKASPDLPDRGAVGPSDEDGTVPGVGAEGYFTATVTTTGAFSGKLTIDGFVLNVAGTFDHEGKARFGTARSFTQFVARTNKPSLTVKFDIGGPPGSVAPAGQIIGEVSATEFKRSVLTSVSTVSADRAHYTGLAGGMVPDEYLTVAGAARNDGMFTVVLPQVPLGSQPNRIADVFTEDDYPKGTGVGTIKVSKAGVVTLTATLADGTPVVASGKLSQDLRVPLFAQLYSLKGFLSTELQLDNSQPDSDVGPAAGSEVLWS